MPGEFFPDKGRAIERLHARELSREAAIERDRSNNAANIREQIEDGTAGVGGKSVHCGICGSPWGDRTQPRNACEDCRREAKQVPPGTRDKLDADELHPEIENE